MEKSDIVQTFARDPMVTNDHLENALTLSA
jgi:hypothetical protein